MKLTKNAIFHPAIVLASLLTLNACLYTDVVNVETIRETVISQNNSSPFQKSLAEEYKQLALYEADEMYDWTDAGVFAKKSLIANGGAKPLPERPKNWNLDFGENRLKSARTRLTALMARGAADKKPILAAKAQANFDCWVEQMEEGWQMDHIELCHNRYQQAVLTLEKQLSTPETISFAVNESRLDKVKKSSILSIAEEAKRQDAPLASIVGYADSSGSKAYNMSLSLSRADEVASVLINAGYPMDRIAVSAYGEDRLLMPTADGISHPQNRRVEILFYPPQSF